MSVKVLGNGYLQRAIFQFLPQGNQDRCKTVSRAFRQNTEAVQREKILKQFSSEAIACIGRARLDVAPIINVRAEAVIIRIEDLPREASFFIGLAAGYAFMVAKIDFFVKGRGFLGCCCTLAVNRGTYLFEPPRIISESEDHCSVILGGTWGLCKKEEIMPAELRLAREMAQLLNGGTIDVPDIRSADPLAPEPEQSCCFSTHIFSCFRRCFFQTRKGIFDPLPAKIKLA